MISKPFQKEQVVMISRDIENFYPSCETNKCIEAIKLLLNQRTIECPSTECLGSCVHYNVFKLRSFQ